MMDSNPARQLMTARGVSVIPKAKTKRALVPFLGRVDCDMILQEVRDAAALDVQLQRYEPKPCRLADVAGLDMGL